MKGLKNSLIFLCLFIFNFLSGCGLENYIIIDPPKNSGDKPLYTSQYSERFFQFSTNEPPLNSTSYVFQGTAVYYRIYTSSSDMISEVNTLENLASEDSTSATAAESMIRKGYVPLIATHNSSMPLIEYTGTDRTIYIRLTDYQDLDDFSARILVGGIGGTNIKPAIGKSVPLRYNGEKTSFNFGRTLQDSQLNKVPVSDDTDVKYGSGPTDGKWYVAMFAVNVGMDTNISPIYSNIIYLGAVCIDQNEEDN